MGLAASQARLLTITSRKSDCEYSSMAFSHEKIALARDMNIVSAEYQDALNQTKLVYDFYGKGDTATDLTYGLLMTPSELNNYMPTPVTDPSGRVVLDSKLAAAARAAGIPQEGLGCTPSSDIRDRFIDGLISSGLITKTVGENVKGVQYNPTMGIGTQDIITTNTESITFENFMDKYLKDATVDLSGLLYDAGGSHYYLGKEVNGHWNGVRYLDNGGIDPQGNNYPTEDEMHNLSIKQILDGNYAIYGLGWDSNKIKDDDTIGGLNCLIDKVGSCSYWDVLFETLSSVIDTNDTYTLAALDYAMQQTQQRVVSLGIGTTLDTSNAAYRKKSNHATDSKVCAEVRDMNDKYVGYVFLHNKEGVNARKYNNGYAINLTNITKAFYTYFAQYMQGFASTDLKVSNLETASTFVTAPTEKRNFSFNILSEVDTTGNNMLIAGFYDALFNQIATKGWVENENVTNKEYMQTMLKNGCMFLSSLADDDYYYMSNYATNTYIKEVTDEEGIALAEAKYQREKAKINSKENIVDMKMKNLDTEITALTTEYETVKSVITNGIKTGFKRYEA